MNTDLQFDQKILTPGGSELTLSVSLCRGAKGNCRFSLFNMTTVRQELLQRLAESPACDILANYQANAPAHCRKLSLALAACPNSCSMPQIKDIGLIACLTPKRIEPQCSKCGLCKDVCREDALYFEDAKLKIDIDKCVGCGQCLKTCPFGAITPSDIKFRVLIGGKMGRHPRFASELCRIEPCNATAFVIETLERIITKGQPAARLADMMDTLDGIEIAGDSV